MHHRRISLSSYLFASLDLSDEEDDQGDEASDSINDHTEHDHTQPAADLITEDETVSAIDSARFAVVEDLQLLLCSMQNAVDDQVHLASHTNFAFLQN
jgi:hypothetical protein